MTQQPQRSDVDPRYTWDLGVLFPTPDDWAAGLAAVEADLPELVAYRGRLAESGATLLAFLDAREDFAARVTRVASYAFLGASMDTRDQAARARQGRVAGLGPKVGAALAFADPELLTIDANRLAELRAEEPGLAVYSRFFERLEERRPHVRSAEVEAVLGQVGAPFAGVSSAYNSLTDTDLRFASVETPEGPRPVSQSSIASLMADPDRAVRRRAFEAFADGYLAHKNTLADLYVTRVRQSSFAARVRGYPSSAQGVLAEKASSYEALLAVVEAFKANVHLWHRYLAARRRALGLEKLGPEDLFAPLARNTRALSYEEASEAIVASMAPLGEEYTGILRRGLLEDRWVDVYPTEGKPNAQFSSGSTGVPFVMMSYSGLPASVGVLAHELGHALHQYLFHRAQPPVYRQMGRLECEVPSNLGQMMLRAHLFDQGGDADFQLSVLDEAFANFWRYFFQMPLLARFELEVHAAVDRGEGLTADRLNGLMGDLLREGYGSEVEVDERASTMWAQFGHLYSPFYTFEYTVGISCAAALSEGILGGKPGAVEDYLAFLRTGTSLPSIESLRRAGVDLSTPAPIERGFAALGQLVDRLERLVDARTPA